MDDKVRALGSVGRSVEGVKCPCGGYAEQVETTAEESRRFGCGLRGCCDRAFVCVVCGTRLVGSAEAPEME